MKRRTWHFYVWLVIGYWLAVLPIMVLLIFVARHAEIRRDDLMLLTSFTGVFASFFALKLAAMMTDRETSMGPPSNAHFLFYLFLDSKKCDAFLGDLNERYKLIDGEFGVRRANFWYWMQALSSVLPVVWAWAKKPAVAAAITWAAAKHLLIDGSWLVMVAEVWKRIRL